MGAPSLWRILVSIVAVVCFVYLAILVLPAVIAGVPMALAIRRRHPEFSARAMLRAAWALRPDALLAAAVFAGCAAGIGYGITFAAGSLLDIARGLFMAGNAVVFLVSVAAASAGAWFFHQILEGKLMKDIFSIVDDHGRFAEFVEADAAPVAIDIDPEALTRAMRAEVIGQDGIITEVSTTLARRAKLQRRAKPLAVFMFVGATGAGKTELAKSLAKHAFEGRLARFDMNEFTESHSTQRLIGAPAGYIGSDQGGQLTREIKRLRSGVILFDEIEKAHLDVYKLLMSLLDEGRVTEQSTGETMDASRFVIVLTSNAEHRALAQLAKTIADPDDHKRAVKDTLQSVFRPEQLARIDEIYCFGKLDRRALAQVIGKFLFSFAADAGVELERVDADLLIETITRHEKQSDYGIRELIRLVEKSVLDGMLDARDAGFTAVAIEADGSSVTVRGVAAQEASA